MNGPSQHIGKSHGLRIFFSSAAVLTATFGLLQLEPMVFLWLGFSDDFTGDEPPWWWMRHQFARGVCSGTALLLNLFIALVAWKKTRRLAESIILISTIVLSADAFRTVVVYIHCPHFFDLDSAVSGWPTLAAYRNDPLISQASMWAAAAGGLLTIVLWLRSRSYPRSGDTRLTTKLDPD